MLIRLLLALSLAVLVPAVAAAQENARDENPELPVLSEVDKLKLQDRARVLQEIELRRQLLDLQRQLVTREMVDMIQSMQKEGFDLNLETLTYTPKAKEPDAKE